MNLSLILMIIILQISIFCQKCGALGYLNKDGKVHCRTCQLTSDCVDIVTETGVINPKEIISESQASDLSRLTISNKSNKFKLKFSSELICKFCKEKKITTQLRQMDQSDEPEVRFLICNGCGKTWRD
jgi:DNA-directed RNA polymerase subunit M/transcription elongation factor TFIIS